MDKFMEFVDRNYVNIKRKLSRYPNFSEDVFHNTILRCNEIIEDNQLRFRTTNDMYRYFMGAYKTNLLREKYYYYEKNSVHPEAMVEQPNEQAIESSADLTIITEDITKTFGEKLRDAYMRHVTENISIQKLQKELGIKNLKQRLRDIREYLIAKYRGDREEEDPDII